MDARGGYPYLTLGVDRLGGEGQGPGQGWQRDDGVPDERRELVDRRVDARWRVERGDEAADLVGQRPRFGADG